MFLQFRAVGLASLVRVEAPEADLVLDIIGLKHDDGVAVGYAHHATCESVRESN